MYIYDTHTHTHTHTHTFQSVPMSELSSMEGWLANVFPLCPVQIEKTLSIEDCGTLTLQVRYYIIICYHDIEIVVIIQCTCTQCILYMYVDCVRCVNCFICTICM